MNRLIIANVFREIAVSLEKKKQQEDILNFIKDEYGIKVPCYVEICNVLVLLQSLSKIPSLLVRDCAIKEINFEYKGPSKELYPNHGVYVDNKLVLNTELLKDKTVIVDRKNGSFCTKFDQTFYHELGHGYDKNKGGEKELSLQEDWMNLSGWSMIPYDNSRKIYIYDYDSPVVEGEYYYNTSAEFTRFYGRRNPWDDWADCFSYYVGGLHSFIPENKKKYFDNLLKDYNICGKK